MNRLKMKFLMFVLAASLGTNASASLLSPQVYEQGGLTWLQLVETAGTSMAAFEAGAGGWNSQYRWATSDEIYGLISHLGLQPTYGYTAGPASAGSFIYALGGTMPDMNPGTWFNPIDTGAVGISPDAEIVAILTQGDSDMELGPDCPAYTNCSFLSIGFGGVSSWDGSDRAGLFLVRLPDAPVPEPGSLALVGLGAALLVMRRRRRQA